VIEFSVGANPMLFELVQEKIEAVDGMIIASARPGLDVTLRPEFIDEFKMLRAFELIEAVMRDPFTGLGKPEPLKYMGAGVWSRRLTQENRLVYLVSDERIDFLQTRYHY